MTVQPTASYSPVTPDATPTQPSKWSPLRVMSWNILEGFHVPKDRVPAGRPIQDEHRLEAAVTVLAEARPDVLLINEALWVNEHDGYLMDYAQRLGFEHAAGDLYDGCWGNVILSHYPIVAHHRFRIHNRGGLRATIAAPGWQLEVATYHPHPDRRPFKKAEDFVTLLTREIIDHPFLIGGDFNAISPEDRPDLAALSQGFSRFSPEPMKSARRFIESGQAVFQALQAHGLRDAVPVHQRVFSMPTDMLSCDKSSAMRIDHIWVNDHVEVEHAEILHSPATNLASDHHPLLATVTPRL